MKEQDNQERLPLKPYACQALVYRDKDKDRPEAGTEESLLQVMAQEPTPQHASRRVIHHAIRNGWFVRSMTVVEVEQ